MDIFSPAHQNHKYVICIHACHVVMTHNQDATGPTVSFQLPVAVHLSLSLNPVAAVCPQGGLGLRDDGGAWGEAGRQLCYRESGRLAGRASELQTTINVRVDAEQCVMGQLILRNVCRGETRRLRRQPGAVWWLYNEGLRCYVFH